MSGERPRGQRRWWRCVVLVAIGLGCVLLVRAPASSGDEPGTPSRTAPASPRDADEPAAKRAALAGELAEARRQLEAASGESRQAVSQSVSLLETLDRLYVQQIAARTQAAELRREREQAQSDLAAARAQGGPPEPFSHSLLQLDSVRDALENERKRGKTYTASVQAAEEALQQANEQFSKRERDRREAKEALESNEDPAAQPGLERTLRRRQLESRVAAEQVHSRELQLKNARLAPDVQALRVRLLREKAEQLAVRTHFSEDELQEQLVPLDKAEADLTQALATAKIELAAAERQWAKAEQELEPGTDVDRAASEELEARRLAQQSRQLAVTVLAQRIHWLEVRKQAWQRRFQVAGASVERGRLAGWAAEARQTLDELAREERVQQARRAELQDVRTSRSDALAAPDLPAVVSRWLRAQQRELDTELRTLDTLLTSLGEARRLHDKLLLDLQTRLGTVSFAQRAHDAMDALRVVWGYEIASVDDRPITIGKVLVGVLLFAFGIALSRFLSQQLGRRVFPRVGLEAGAAAALQSLSFYVFVSLLTLLALNVINVPLTAFTLAGGALAIGVGFGSQNIVNNFISGLILFIERPIRIGDMIEVDGTYGVVEHIGARSTRVRSFSNIHIIVPNSSFLEKNVVNWTLSDDQIRTQVTVGVAYGSPTRTVNRLIQQAVDEHPSILKVPAPAVIFTDFGDNALIFDVYFWIRMRKQMDRRRIESDTRYRIDELFREANITIAFPQRDVHLDSVRPVEVRLVTDDART